MDLGPPRRQAKTAAAETALKYLDGVQSIDASTGKAPEPSIDIGKYLLS